MVDRGQIVPTHDHLDGPLLLDSHAGGCNEFIRIHVAAIGKGAWDAALNASAHRIDLVLEVVIKLDLPGNDELPFTHFGQQELDIGVGLEA